MADPVALPPGQAITLAFTIERHRSSLQERRIDVLEGIDTHNCVDMPFDCAGDDRNDAAPGADIELSSPRPEEVPRYTIWVLDKDSERACGA